MINAGTVAASLTLDTNPFKAGIASANSQLKAFRDENLTTAEKIQGVGGALTTIGGTLTKNLTLPIVGAGVAAVKMESDYESAFAGVRKTVDATEEEYQKLSDGILDMSQNIPTAVEGIAEVMESAGQLGIAKTNIFGQRKKSADVFQYAPPGCVTVACSGLFPVEVTFLTQRSEPRWN